MANPGIDDCVAQLQAVQQSWMSQIDSNAVSDCALFAVQSSVEMLAENENEQAEKMAKLVLDLTWEQLNTGHWSDVHISWRRLYTFAAAVRLLALCRLDRMKDALQCCDNGLVMGAPFRENLLTVFAAKIHQHLFAQQPCNLSDHLLKAEQEAKVPAQIDRVLTQFCRGIEHRTEIARLRCPSLEVFLKDYLIADKPLPVLIEGALDAWPALVKWNLSYILRIAGYRTVPVEIGSKYTEEDWSQKLMTIKELVENYFNTESVGYLAQHDLFHQIPELRNDIRVPEYCCLLCPPEDVDVNAWFGPKGTVSPLHTDPKDNLFAQAFGTKYVCLCPPWEPEFVYPIEEGIMTNTSQVDMGSPDFDRFPLLRNVQLYETVLKAGDLLFIPKGWWHYLKSLSISFSVSFWFQPSEEC